jgi:DNA-binding NarL/FixJ family response regulator
LFQRRFVGLATVQRELQLSGDEVLSLVKSGDLPAIYVSGKWRVERAVLEQFIGRLYARTRAMLNDPEGAGDAAEPGWDDLPVIRTRIDGEADDQENVLLDLPPQMHRVLGLVAHGMSNAEIANALTLEVSTVKSHVSRLLARLEQPTRERLIAYAWAMGVVPLEE